MSVGFEKKTFLNTTISSGREGAHCKKASSVPTRFQAKIQIATNTKVSTLKWPTCIWFLKECGHEKEASRKRIDESKTTSLTFICHPWDLLVFLAKTRKRLFSTNLHVYSNLEQTFRPLDLFQQLILKK